ncbi:MAG: hypothetical protein ACI92O_000362 [Colwellia sp.]|jgi:hypothetical protein
MDFITIAKVVIVLGLILIVLSKILTKQSGSKEATYTQRGALFTVAERSFYGVLEQSISQEYKIFGKVRVADVLKPTSKMNKSDWQSAFNKISAKHFDYVLCQKDTLNVVAVVELDDKSHNSKRAISRDAFLEEACDGANLKLIRFKAQKGYQIDSVRKLIIETLDSVQATVVLNYNDDSRVTESICENNNSLSDVELESKYARPSEKISSSNLAKKLGIKTPVLLEKMVNSGYLTINNDAHHLTEEGKNVGGEFIAKGRYPAHFIWSADLNLTK